MESNPKIAVLLSTYNGESFIRDQIASILKQRDVSVDIYVRDDGSTDDTISILNEFVAIHSNIEVSFGQNIGVFKSFMTLLDNADNNFDYYAFADQDDVWKPDKLITAVNQLKNNHLSNMPAMYYGRLEFTDEFLNILGFSQIPDNSGFNNALVQNQATGCTIVLNRKARELLCSKIPEWALMHDWWCYLVVSAFGEVVYDEIPLIYYRKHGKNVTPATPIFMVELWARVKRWLGDGKIAQKVTDQALVFQNLFGEDLSPDKKNILDGYLSTRNKNIIHRANYALNMPLRRNTSFDNLILRVLIILGKF